MGMSQSFPPIPDRNDSIALIRAAVERGVTLFDTAAGLRAVRQRGHRRRGARAAARPGRHRDQVRVRALDRQADRHRQPTGDDPLERRRLPAAAADGLHRPALPASRRPERPDRRGRGHRQGADRGTARSGTSGCPRPGSEHPPRARRSAGDGAAERILPLVARAGGTRSCPRSRSSASASSPSARSARGSSPARSTPRPSSARATSATPSRASPTAAHCEANLAFVDLVTRIAERKHATPARSPSPGCSRRGRGSCPIPGTDEAAPARREHRRSRPRADGRRPQRNRRGPPGSPGRPLLRGQRANDRPLKRTRPAQWAVRIVETRR